MGKYILWRNIDYYPYIMEEYDNINDAIKGFEKYNEALSDGEWILGEVIRRTVSK